MGMYINPPIDIYPVKEVWILSLFIEQGENSDHLIKEIKKDEFISMKWEDVPENKVMIVLINNGAFAALMVLYCAYEFQYVQKMCQSPREFRQMFFLVIDKQRAMEYAA